MIIGMDFGTTNSGIATYDGRRLQLLPFGTSPADGNITRTALYVTNDQTVTIGRAAIDQYQAHNLGRPSRIERFKIGMTSITYPDIGTVWEDIYSERDVLAPGRLFLSFKSSLSSTAYRGTTVGSLDYELEDVVAIYLYVAKIRAEQALGQEISDIVLGRPVHFADDPEADALAERRLIEAAWRAGYETVYLQYEPVAVALEYATSIESEQHVLVFDFGGGTLDVAVVRLDNRGQRQVLARGGIPIAGAVFDQRVVRNKLAPRLGEGTHFGPRNKRRDVPTWIFDDLSNWQTIPLLQATRHAPLLNDLRATTDQPGKIEPLLQIISQNHGLTMFDAVERAKRRLSDKTEAAIVIAGEQLDIREPITRPEFERLIQREVRAVDELIDTVVRDADLDQSDIDMVVRTGGSSQIPVFVELLRHKFGSERVRAVDTFSSVTAGLGVMAHRIAMGEAELPAHRRLAATNGTEETNLVNIRFLRRWIDAQEESATATDAQRTAFVQLGSEGHVLATLLPDQSWTKRQSLPLSMQDGVVMGNNQVALATLDERVLLVTSSYRFLLTTPRRLLVLQEMGLRLVELERFAPGERVCVLTPWSAIENARWLTIIANQGDMRLLDLAKLKSSLERALPVQLDQKPAGTPVAALGADEGQEIALVTDVARALRVTITATAAVGMQAIKRDKDEAIVAALPLRTGDQLLLISPAGVTRTVGAIDIPLRSHNSARGKVIALRFAVGAAVVQAPDDELWLVTSTHLRPLGASPPSSASRKQGQARIDLEVNEQIIALLHAHPEQSPAQAMSDE